MFETCRLYNLTCDEKNDAFLLTLDDFESFGNRTTHVLAYFDIKDSIDAVRYAGGLIGRQCGYWNFNMAEDVRFVSSFTFDELFEMETNNRSLTAQDILDLRGENRTLSTNFLGPTLLLFDEAYNEVKRVVCF